MAGHESVMKSAFSYEVLVLESLCLHSKDFLRKTFRNQKRLPFVEAGSLRFLEHCVHAIPVGIAILEIGLNCKGHYVGAKFKIHNYLQFAAKAHEVLIQSSVATILLSYIRHQINTDKGMPFGAVLSGSQFLQVIENAFWNCPDC